MAHVLNYAPFAALAIALTLVTSLACRRGHDYLIRSLWALGTILWLSLSWVLQTSTSIRHRPSLPVAGESPPPARTTAA